MLKFICTLLFSWLLATIGHGFGEDEVGPFPPMPPTHHKPKPMAQPLHQQPASSDCNLVTRCLLAMVAMDGGYGLLDAAQTWPAPSSKKN